MDLKERCQLQASKILQNVFCSENIENYLDIVVKFPHMSHINQLLIYRQMPEATKIAGEQAWNAIGRKLIKDAKPIVLLSPKFIQTKEGTFTKEFESPRQTVQGSILYDIEPEYSHDFVPIIAFDISQTQGNESIAIPDMTKFEERVCFLMNVSTVSAKKEDIPKAFPMGYFAPDEKIIYLKEGISDRDRDAALLDIYTDYCIDVSDAKGSEFLGVIVKNVLRKYFNLPVNPGIYRFLDRHKSEPEQIKEWYLYEMRCFGSKIIQDLVGYHLEFDETAILNYLLNTDNFSEMTSYFSEVAKSITCPWLVASMENIREKLNCSRPGYIEELYRKKEMMELYTYPPCKFPVDARYAAKRSAGTLFTNRGREQGGLDP